MGNFFAMMSFGLFTVFWLSFGMLQLPTLGLAATYSPTGNAAEGAASVGYNASIALFLIVWGFVMFTYFLFTLRTNTVFAGIFFTATVGCFLLSAAYWEVSAGHYATAAHLQTVSSSNAGEATCGQSLTYDDVYRPVVQYSSQWVSWAGIC